MVCQIPNGQFQLLHFGLVATRRGDDGFAHRFGGIFIGKSVGKGRFGLCFGGHRLVARQVAVCVPGFSQPSDGNLIGKRRDDLDPCLYGGLWKIKFHGTGRLHLQGELLLIGVLQHDARNGRVVCHQKTQFLVGVQGFGLPGLAFPLPFGAMPAAFRVFAQQDGGRKPKLLGFVPLWLPLLHIGEGRLGQQADFIVFPAGFLPITEFVVFAARLVGHRLVRVVVLPTVVINLQVEIGYFITMRHLAVAFGGRHQIFVPFRAVDKTADLGGDIAGEHGLVKLQIHGRIDWDFFGYF